MNPDLWLPSFFPLPFREAEGDPEVPAEMFPLRVYLPLRNSHSRTVSVTSKDSHSDVPRVSRFLPPI